MGSKMFQKNVVKKILCLGLVLLIVLSAFTNISFAEEESTLTNTTRAYFCSEITKTYGNGDCILLENYDESGNKVYGLIDSGRKITTTDSDGNSSTVVKEFLKDHGVEKLEFFIITHSHSDHFGDALTVLENFEIDTLIIKEFDTAYSDGPQSTYEAIIEAAIDKNIEVIGVSYYSLFSESASPSRTASFISYVEDAQEDLFEGFYYNSDEDNNIIFEFGSSTIQLYNWELFDTEGNQYITGVTTDATKEGGTGTNENNNSLAILLTQGNKKALFAGDMNNLTEDNSTGVGTIGDEDRLKDEIGDIDFLKAGHHGYQYSNTDDYINVLSPEYVVITNDIGGAYRDLTDYLEENNVQYLYTTTDEYAVTATITEDNVYLGFETTNGFKDVNGEMIYIAEGDEYADYTTVSYNIQYEDETVTASSWSELEEIIENNKDEITIDDENRICTLKRLIIDLESGGDWTATSQISIELWQEIVLTSSENINILRGTSLKSSNLFYVNGYLCIGTEEMTGTITLDGNKDNVSASTTLLKIENGILDIYDNVTLCNNLNKTTSRTKNATTQDYTSFGSAIYCTNGTINMYGGSISNNNSDVVYSATLPKSISNYYRYSCLGVGLYLTNNSTFNMLGGEICENVADNHSTVTTNSNYTTCALDRGITQGICGVGIYAGTNSNVNLSGGKIIDNEANNDSVTTIVAGTSEEIDTNVYSINASIYGVGVYSTAGTVTITNGFEISNNTANLNSSITIDEGTTVKSSVNAAARGVEVYVTGTDLRIDDAVISDASFTSDLVTENNGSIGTSGTSSISTYSFGGGIDIISSNFSINQLVISNCVGDFRQGAGIYINASEGNICNSEFSNNNSAYQGGGVFLYKSDVTIENTTISDNIADYGAGVYIGDTSSNTTLNNIVVENNSTTTGSGGGIYAYGDLVISGDDTVISNNTAYTYGGGVNIKTKALISGGVISNNAASTYSGGGINVDGTLILKDTTVSNNTANKYGGGVNYTNSNATFYWVSGSINGNTAGAAGNEIYPEEGYIADATAPTIEISKIPTGWSKEDIEVTITVTDENSGISEVTVNGEMLEGTDGVYTYTVAENGTYTVVATDYALNETTQTFEISNIDKTAPTITGVEDDGIYTKTVTISVSDTESGVSDIYIAKDSSEYEYTLESDGTIKITENGSYAITATDNAGNFVTIYFEINRKTSELTTYQKAIQEVANAYYLKGDYAQYCSYRKSFWFSPEEATSQNTIYSVCSDYTYSVYYQTFGTRIPISTATIIAYGKAYYDSSNIETNDIIEYWEKTTDNGNTVYEDNEENTRNIDLSTASGRSDYADYLLNDLGLQVGDILCYHNGTDGHALLVYEIIYNDDGDAVDAVIRESTSKYETSTTKITKGLSYASLLNENYDVNEGTFQERYLLNTYTSSSERTRNSVLYGMRNQTYFTIYRPLLTDEDGNYTGTYYYQTYKTDSSAGTGYTCTNRTEVSYEITDSAIARLQYSGINIEKTVNVFNNSNVELGDTLEYTITVTNTSDTAYNDFDIIENITDYVEIVDSNSGTEGDGTITWTVSNLGAGETYTVTYKVQVKNDYTLLGSTITSTGTVAGIASATVTNTIECELEDEEKVSLAESLEDLIEGEQYTGEELISKTYESISDVDLKLDELDITNLVQNTTNSTTYKSVLLNTENEFYEIVLNGYWGGVYTNSSGSSVLLKYWEENPTLSKLEGTRSERVNQIHVENLQTGDILVLKNEQTASSSVTYETESGTYYLIYISDEDTISIDGEEVSGFIGLDEDGNLKNIGTDYTSLQTLLGKDYYAVLRPSMVTSLDYEAPTIEISEIPTEWRKEDIEVTITVTDEFSGINKVTVNDEVLEGTDGVYTYTVAENGTYTVVATDYASNEATQTFEVSNIDKIAPTLTGVEEGINYVGSTTISVVDDGSGIYDLVILKDMDEYVYTENEDGSITISDVGNYIITAVDNADNYVTVRFEIIEKQEEDDNNDDEEKDDDDNKDISEITITSETYSIAETDIYKIQNNTTAEAFKESITTNSTSCKITNSEGEEITDTDLIATGMILTLSDGTEYTLIVRGDTDSNGEITLTDLSRVVLNYSDETDFKLEGAELKAADLSCDGKISLMDLSQMIILYMSI